MASLQTRWVLEGDCGLPGAIHAAVPNIAQLLNEVSESLGTYHFVLALASSFFSIPKDLQSQDQFSFIRKGEKWTF